MNRFEYKTITELGPRGGMRLIGVVWDRLYEQTRIRDISKYQAKQWMHKNQEEMFPYLETE